MARGGREPADPGSSPAAIRKGTAPAGQVEHLLFHFGRLPPGARQVFLTRAAVLAPGWPAVDLDRFELSWHQRRLLAVFLAAGPGTPVPIADVLRAVYGIVARDGWER